MPLDTASSVDDLIKQYCGWDAYAEPAVDKNGKPAVSGRQFVYRSDTDQQIGDIGGSTVLLQHRKVIQPFLDSLEDRGVDRIYVRRPNPQNLEDLRGTKGAYVWATEDKLGAHFQMEAITGNFISPTGDSAWLPDGPPTCFEMFRGQNGHDGTLAASFTAERVKLDCMNGLVRSDYTASVKSKHTTRFNVDAFREKILNSIAAMSTDRERFEQYIKTPCSRAKAETFFKRTLAWKAPDRNGDEQVKERLLQTLMLLFDKEPVQSVWSVYQALTAWATHDSIREGAQLISGRNTRRAQVAAAMRTGHFTDLLPAA